MNWLALVPALGTLIDRLLPDPAASEAAKLKLMELAQNGELAKLSADTELMKAQAAINLADAQSGSNFRGGWRPFVGWACGLALAWDWVAKPLMLTAWALTGHALPEVPQLDVEQIVGVLFALLGLSTLRTAERLKGKA